MATRSAWWSASTCIREVRAERPKVPLQVTDVVFARTKVGIFDRAQNLRARRSRSLEMRVEVVDIHVESLRSRSEHLRTGHGLIRPCGPKHDDVRTELQLRMPDDLSGLRNREQFDETERLAQRLYRATSVVVSENRKDRLHASPCGLA